MLRNHVRGCPLDWSRDGEFLLYEGSPDDGTNGGRLWMHSVFEKAEPTAIEGTRVAGPRTPRGRISPNGRWLAYETDASGRRDIYVRSFPESGGETWQISSQGGIEPHWRGDGRELFFLAADKSLMAVPVVTEGLFRAGTPRVLFSTDLDPVGLPVTGRNQYIATPDGQRFVMKQRGSDAVSVVVVLNWPAALAR